MVFPAVHHGHPHGTVEQIGLPEIPVLAQAVPVVGTVNEDGVFFPQCLPGGGQHLAQQGVGVFHHSVIGGPHPAHILRGQVLHMAVGDPLLHGRVHGPHIFRCHRGIWGQLVIIFFKEGLRRHIGAVGAVQAHSQQQRAAVSAGTQKIHRRVRHIPVEMQNGAVSAAGKLDRPANGAGSARQRPVGVGPVLREAFPRRLLFHKQAIIKGVGLGDIAHQPRLEPMVLVVPHKVHPPAEHGLVPGVGQAVGKGGNMKGQRLHVVVNAGFYRGKAAH